MQYNTIERGKFSEENPGEQSEENPSPKKQNENTVEGNAMC